MKIKICGITTPEVLQFCCDAGIDFVGLVFVEHSPRYVSPKSAKLLLDSIRISPIKRVTKTVGLFQDAPLQQVVDTALYTGVDYIQLHGAERVDFVDAVKAATQKPVIKAFGIENLADFDVAKAYDTVCDMLLFDAKSPKHSIIKGGHGVAFHWGVLSAMPDFVSPWFLAGGITLENIETVIPIAGVEMLDISSGVEKSKGIKDIQKIQSVINLCTIGNSI